MRKSALRYPKKFLELRTTDRCTLVLCAAQGDLKCLPEVVSVYRQHPGGIWTGSSLRTGFESDLANNKFIAEVAGGFEAKLAKRRVARSAAQLYHFFMDEGLLDEARAVAAELDWRQLLHAPGLGLKLLLRILLPSWYTFGIRLRNVFAPAFHRQ